MVSTVLENGLEGELGYSKYDYRNKETDNSRAYFGAEEPPIRSMVN